MLHARCQFPGYEHNILPQSSLPRTQLPAQLKGYIFISIKIVSTDAIVRTGHIIFALNLAGIKYNIKAFIKIG